MARPLRLEFPGAIYHVTGRNVNMGSGLDIIVLPFLELPEGGD
jgi:hypothetical protein